MQGHGNCSEKAATFDDSFVSDGIGGVPEWRCCWKSVRIPFGVEF